MGLGLSPHKQDEPMECQKCNPSQLAVRLEQTCMCVYACTCLCACECVGVWEEPTLSSKKKVETQRKCSLLLELPPSCVQYEEEVKERD